VYIHPVACFSLEDRDHCTLVRLGYDSRRVDIAYGLYQEVLDTHDDEQFHMLILAQLLGFVNPGVAEAGSTTAALTRHPALLEHPGTRGLLATVNRFVEKKLQEREVEQALCDYLTAGELSKSQTSLLKDDLGCALDTAALCDVTLREADAKLAERLGLLAGVHQRFRELTETSLSIRDSLLYPLWQTYIPLAEWIVERVRARRRSHPHDAYVLGLGGPQGSGKSTIGAIVRLLLEAKGYAAAALSIDDIYRTYDERQALRAECPHYRFRGLPGTHDVDLGRQTIRKLRQNADGTVIRVPAFDKSLRGGQGDRLPEDQWPTVDGKVDVVLFEGWCVGARPQSESALEEPINSIEASSDYDDSVGSFRRRVNDELRRYGPLFDECDDLIVLRVPNPSNVYRWRGLQEEKLKAATGAGMDLRMVGAFVDHFLPATERYVAAMGEDPAAGASLVLTIGDDRSVRAVTRFEAVKETAEPVDRLMLQDEEAIKRLFRHPHRTVQLDMGTALIVTDGVGVAPIDKDNPLYYCETPNLNTLASPAWCKTLAPLWDRSRPESIWPDRRQPRAKTSVLTTCIHAASEELGLKRDQPGDSAVGHSALGLGRYVRRYIGIIWDAIENRTFTQNEAVRRPIEHVRRSRGRYPRPKLHIWGFCSRGYIHSDLDILFEILTVCAREGLRKEEVVLHVVTDGKDVPKETSGEYVSELEDTLLQLGVGVIGTICGRDGWIGNRDRRFIGDRNGPAARCVLEGKGVLPDAPSALAAIEQGRESPMGREYGADLDRFLPPTHIGGRASQVESGDAMLCFNLREDRSLLFPQEFVLPMVDAGRLEDFIYSTLIELPTLQGQRPYHLVAYRQREDQERAPISLLRAGYMVRAYAESEKASEVTSAYLGARCETIAGRLGTSSCLLQVNSERYPSTPTHPDEEPEMRANEVRQLVQDGMGRGAAVIANFCNGDVIGHYGEKSVTQRAMSVVDEQIGQILDAAQERGVILLITADHGCVETWGPMHSANLVPFQVVFPERFREMAERLVIGHGVKTLADVESTRFMLLGVPQPAHMTGDSILIPDVNNWSDEQVAREVLSESAKNNFALLRRCPDKGRIRRIIASLTKRSDRQVVRMFLLHLERRLQELLDAQCPFVSEFMQVLPSTLQERFQMRDEAELPHADSSETASSDGAVREVLDRLGGAATSIKSTTGRTHLLFHLGRLCEMGRNKARALGAEVAERTDCAVYADGARLDRTDDELALADALRAAYFIVRPPAIEHLQNRAGMTAWIRLVERLRKQCLDRRIRLLVEYGGHPADSQQTSLWRQVLEQGNVGLILNLDGAMNAGRAEEKEIAHELRRILLDPVFQSHVQAVRACDASPWFMNVIRYFEEQGRDVAALVTQRTDDATELQPAAMYLGS
jgi:D-glycerate 3-kinase